MTASLNALPTELLLAVDGKPAIVSIPARMASSWGNTTVDLPCVSDADAKVTLKEWSLLDSLAWNEYNSWAPSSPDIIGIACWSWSVCEGSGVGRGAGGVVASLIKKGLVAQDGFGEEAALGFTLLGWVTWLTVRNRRIASGEAVRTS